MISLYRSLARPSGPVDVTHICIIWEGSLFVSEWHLPICCRLKRTRPLPCGVTAQNGVFWQRRDADA